MQLMTFDPLGRIKIPAEIIQRFALSPKQNLLIRLDETNARLILCPTEEKLKPFGTGRELRERQAAIKQLPTSRWAALTRRIDWYCPRPCGMCWAGQKQRQ